MPEPAHRSRAADFPNQFVELPDFSPTPVPAPQRAAPPAADPFAAPFPPSPVAPSQPPAFDPPPAIPRPAPRPPEQPSFSRPIESEPFAPQGGAAAVQPLPPPPVAPSPGDARGQGLQRFLEGLAAGAGVSPETFSGRDPGELGFELGEYVKVSVEQLAHLLRARAAAKAITKSSSRTMISAMDNNPLKFIPVPAEIIEIMFTRRRPGFLGSKASLEAGFGDLKRHELATFAAMQKALGPPPRRHLPGGDRGQGGRLGLLLQEEPRLGHVRGALGIQDRGARERHARRLLRLFRRGLRRVQQEGLSPSRSRQALFHVADLFSGLAGYRLRRAAQKSTGINRIGGDMSP